MGWKDAPLIDEPPPTYEWGAAPLIEEPPKRGPQITEPPNFIERQLAKINLPAAMDDLRGSKLYGLMQGMADPVAGAVQLAANQLPDITGIPGAVNKRIAEQNQQYETARAARGREGFDFARLGGNVASPANIVPARALTLPGAFSSVGRMAGAGALGGGAGAAMQPVTDPKDQENFWTTKAVQTGAGALTGAALTPAVGKLAEIVVPRVMRFFGNTPADKLTPDDIEGAIRRAFKDAKIEVSEMDPAVLDGVRAQVRQSLAGGKTLDISAAARKAEFESLGMKPTLGQITRDPTQYAREVNLRGVEGVGEPLQVRFTQQGQAIRDRLGNIVGEADEVNRAGERVMGALRAADEVKRKGVSQAYGAVRAATGKDADVPLQGLAQDAADIAHRYGDALPSGVRNQLGDFGILPAQPGKQTKVFTFDESEKLLQSINRMRSKTDDARNSALDELSSAIKRANSEVDVAGGPYATPRALAKERFDMQDAIPALKAAVQGDIAPEDFVRRFVTGGKVDDVVRMGELLRKNDRAAWADARSQIGAEIQRAAYGEDAAGSKVFSPERYAKKLREIGTDKLRAFYSAEEVKNLKSIERVGAYIYSHPERAAVNTSNTSGALMSLLQRLPFGNQTLSLGQAAAGAIQRGSRVKTSMAANVPEETLGIGADLERQIADYLGRSSVNRGSASGSGL